MYYQEYNRKTVLLNNGTDDGKAGLSLKNMENQVFLICREQGRKQYISGKRFFCFPNDK